MTGVGSLYQVSSSSLGAQWGSKLWALREVALSEGGSRWDVFAISSEEIAGMVSAAVLAMQEQMPRRDTTDAGKCSAVGGFMLQWFLIGQLGDRQPLTTKADIWINSHVTPHDYTSYRRCSPHAESWVAWSRTVVATSHDPMFCPAFAASLIFVHGRSSRFINYIGQTTWS